MGVDYHFLILAPGLSSTWLFQAGRQYWHMYQPIITDDPDLLRHLPAEATVAVTAIARPDQTRAIREQLEAIRPDIIIDMIASSELPSLEAMLNQRTRTNHPLGSESA